MQHWYCDKCGVEITCPLCEGDGHGRFDAPFSLKTSACPKCGGTGRKDHKCVPKYK